MRDSPTIGPRERPQASACGQPPHFGSRTFARPALETQRSCILVRPAGEVLIVDVLDAELLAEDREVEVLGSSLLRLAREGHDRFLLNLEGVEYVSSPLLAALACLHQRVTRSGGFLRLCRLEPRLLETLRVCRLDRFFEIHDTESEALADRDRLDSPGETVAKATEPDV